MASLWLFDIDGVLVNVPEVHTKAYRANYRHTLGIELSDDTIMSKFGATELATHIAIFDELGIPKDSTTIDRLISQQPSYLIALLRPRKIEPLDGVVEFLAYLKGQKEYLGVITGNLKGPAEFILEKSGLRKFFTVISYDDGKIMDRSIVLQRAVEEAKKLGYSYIRIVTIGDTPYDVQAGKSIGAFTVAVSTGTVGYEMLMAQNPDMTLKTLKAHQRILEALQ